MKQVHVIGAGLSGLSCALRLSRAGATVSLYDAAAQAGGRCRSYWDGKLDRRIDNGNHLLLSANHATLDYLGEIGARNRFVSPPQASFPFVDLSTGERWTISPGPSPIPWWIFQRDRRVPGSHPFDYISFLQLAAARADMTVAAALPKRNLLWDRFWRPFCTSALNTAPEEASAQLLWRTIRETFAKGSGACLPLVPKDGLSDSFVDPALRIIQASGNFVRFNHRLRSFEFDGSRIVTLDFGDRRIELGANDMVVVALPPGNAGQVLPGLKTPDDSRPIVNVHLRIDLDSTTSPLLPLNLPFLGLTGGSFDWVFLRRDVASLTVSAAAELAEQPAEQIAQQAWAETAQALMLDPATAHEVRVVKERRATFAQTPAALKLRPGARTAWHNLLLAGDWTDTGYPATIESAVRSGNNAAALAAEMLR
ncbi:hydroxysqualene dehydroxylase HpnE [Pelagibius sp. Alg239-R121]|uniref:hydroxysqualene dehydroxylase HpnE n=1 Tax=Pelagibius sp. Alg239-R121 TaxID=2993448 RepID=UPI0024A74D64|nr:hydroxysqualene dehydroxylase HpnE [Pelagibius sp. Alg239-R121]